MTNAEQTAAIAELQQQLGDLREATVRLARLHAIEVIERRIAPVAPTIDDSGEYGAVVKASDLLGTDEGQE